MSDIELYNLWIKNASDDEDLINELESIKENQEEIYDRFYKDLEFGTAGLRGVIGAGTNRMNIYTIRRATQGMANYIKLSHENARVAISYDSRIKSELFAREAARVLAGNGINVLISKELQPTPFLSFAVREYNCQAGIMVTASHNPAKYNGYKCYGADGCQMTDKSAGDVYEQIQKIDIFNDIKICEFDQAVSDGLIKHFDDSLQDKYLDCVLSQSINKDVCKNSNLKVVFTPLNGAGNKLVRKTLNLIGIENVAVVKEQEEPDGTFKTCPYPNPEFKEALELALKLANKVKPDLVVATDPDSDRVGIAVKHNDEYKLLTGNEVAILLINYILSCRKLNRTLPSNPVAVKTIVSSEMTTRIAEKYGCEMINVLTGFKYIGEQILNLEEKGESNRFIFGFEESYGYLSGTYVRDKDAVVASMLICEMAAYYGKTGKSLIDVLQSLYKIYGYYQAKTLNFNFEGAKGMEKMAEIMGNLRDNRPNKIGEYRVIKFSDYLKSETINLLNNSAKEIKLPKSNVLVYRLQHNNSVIVRPSGTEPKIKVYITAVGKDLESSKNIINSLENEISKLLNY